MRKPFIMLTTFATLGLLVGLSSLGIGTNLIYRSGLALAILLRFGWFAWDAQRRPAQSN